MKPRRSFFKKMAALYLASSQLSAMVEDDKSMLIDYKLAQNGSIESNVEDDTLNSVDGDSQDMFINQQISDFKKNKNETLRHHLNKQERVSNGNYLLKLYNPDTGEILVSRFSKRDKLPFEEHMKINYFLRDFREDKTKPFSENLIKSLGEILSQSDGSYMVIHSGYRTQRTNDFLANLGFYVSKNSYHMKAKAIDFSIVGIDNVDTYQLARKLHSGGIGYYPTFIHIDEGRQRKWFIT